MKMSIALVLLVVAVSLAKTESVPTKVIHMNLYFYDKITSPNATGVRVAGPNGETNTTTFGSFFVIDNQIFDGPNFTTANQIGRAKGTFMIAAVDVSHALLVFSAVLETKEFNGAICFRGTDKSIGTLGTKEIAVVGGTGDFRYAKGWANYTTTYLNIPDSVAWFQTTILLPQY